MAKKTASSKTPVRKFTKRKILAVVVSILVAIVALLIADKTYRHNQYVNKQSAIERQNYTKVDAQMKGVMAQLKATVGEPYELHYDHGCGYTAAKYSRGQLNCSIFYTFTYQVNSIEEGKALTLNMLQDIKKLSDGYAFSLPKNPSEVLKDLSYSYKPIHPIGLCDFSYSLSNKQIHNDNKADSYQKAVSANYAAEYNYHCGGIVVKALYPVEDSSE